MKILTLSHLLSGVGFLLCLFFIRESIDRIETAKRIKNEVAQIYFGPRENSQKNKNLIRVELHVKDSAKTDSPQIKRVIFDGKSIPLKPRGVFDERGDASFQLPPGTYLLKWEIQSNSRAFPRSTTYKKEIQINENVLWIQIMIEGDSVSIL